MPEVPVTGGAIQLTAAHPVQQEPTLIAAARPVMTAALATRVAETR